METAEIYVFGPDWACPDLIHRKICILASRPWATTRKIKADIPVFVKSVAIERWISRIGGTDTGDKQTVYFVYYAPESPSSFSRNSVMELNITVYTAFSLYDSKKMYPEEH